MVQFPNDKPPDHSDESAGMMANRAAALGPDKIDGAADKVPLDADGDPIDLLRYVSMAEARNQVFMGAIQRTSWMRSIKAYRSEHPAESKYWTEPFKNRTKLFRPKTRTAVRKNMATAAAAFFSNSDVVTIRAQFDDDPVKLASAEVLHQLLNYRLDRTTVKSGTPWFLTLMGAVQDAQIHAICVSKQYWEYQTVQRSQRVVMLDDMGVPVLGEDGMPAMEEQPYDKIVRDRPMTLLIPPENVMVDPAAPWYDPAQLSSYFIAMHPMTIDEAKTMLRNPGKGNEQWIEVDDASLKQASEDYTTKGVRLARGGGTDRYDNRTDDQGTDSGIVWMYENFFRVGGEDYHFWSVGRRAYASRVRLTEEAYPEQHGERPYVYGFGALEAHQTFPMSPVESWLQMQNEMNEQVNLSIDIMKQSLSPIAKVVQGTMFDWKQLQKRGGPDATIIVRKQEDLKFQQPPPPNGTSYVEMAHLNGDFDDLSGTTSGGSVANNRQMNETVGGMRLLTASNNAVTEFDLRVFGKTWAEPTVRQLVRLEQYYESDEVALAIAGQKAKLWEKFGVSQLNDQDLMHEVEVMVNVGIGASDPMQRLAKLSQGMDMLMKLAPTFKGRVFVKPERAIHEVMGAMGFNDGLSFFDIQEDQPSMMQLQMMVKMALEKAKLDAQIKAAEIHGESSIEAWRQRSVVQIIDTILKQMGDVQAIQTDALMGAQRYIHDTLVDNIVTHMLSMQPATNDINIEGSQLPGMGGQGGAAPQQGPPPLMPPPQMQQAAIAGLARAMNGGAGG